MPEENDTKTEIQVETSSTDVEEPSIDELKDKLTKQQETITSYEKKIQYLLADFENLKKRTESDIQNRVNSILSEIMLKFLSIYDDFVRAKEALVKQNVNTEGLDAILKNMDSFLSEYDVIPIDALGEIFDPKLHEAITIKEDPKLDNDTITAEIRKGYILQNRVIRPSLVEISKTSKNDLA
ncbi:MAG TPA: nucleotide exchange factor GrpE, partial [Nitrosopumilaceae archaeon]|nr:nucleotide exchange factor GrpE [Nitrosopumilaceae archaeon]